MTAAASSVINFTQGVSSALKVTLSPSPLGVGDNVNISIFAQERYTLVSPYQNADRAPALGQQEFEEDIDINNSTEVTTNYPVAELISATYLTPMIDVKNRTIRETAGQPAIVDIINSVVSLDGSDLVGTIRIKYKTYAAQTYKLSGFLYAGSHVVFYKKDVDSDWIPFIFSVGVGQPDEKSQPSIVTVQVKDFCTDLPIPGATPFVDNQIIDQADINGKVVAGLMGPGAHSLKVQAEGYIPTDSDGLQNDSFQV